MKSKIGAQPQNKKGTLLSRNISGVQQKKLLRTLAIDQPISIQPQTKNTYCGLGYSVPQSK